MITFACRQCFFPVLVDVWNLILKGVQNCRVLKIKYDVTDITAAFAETVHVVGIKICPLLLLMTGLTTILRLDPGPGKPRTFMWN